MVMATGDVEVNLTAKVSISELKGTNVVPLAKLIF